jgi:hypothetical protein
MLIFVAAELQIRQDGENIKRFKTFYNCLVLADIGVNLYSSLRGAAKIEGENTGVWKQFAKNNDVGTYTTKIKWGVLDIDVRPFGKGYWGKRVSQTNPRVDMYELKINPNNESFYLPHPDGGFVQFENVVNTTVQDGKLIMDKSSIYYVAEKPDFLNISSVLEPAQRQLSAAKSVGYKVEWLVSDEKAVQQLTQYFKDKNIDITVKLLKE